MVRYKILFDVGDYISTSIFANRHEAEKAAKDFVQRYQSVKPEAICKIKFVTA